MAKRTRKNTLKAYWSKKENDVMFCFPDGNQTKTDGHFLYNALGTDRYHYDSSISPSILKELEDRGYDLTTLIFSICKKQNHSRWTDEDIDTSVK